MIYVAGIKIGVVFHKIKLKKKKRKKKEVGEDVAQCSGSRVWSGTKKQNNAF